MADFVQRGFDESTSSTSPNYSEGSVVTEGGRFYGVSRTERIRGSELRAWLEELLVVSEKDRAAASEWGWDREASRFRWMPAEKPASDAAGDA